MLERIGELLGELGDVVIGHRRELLDGMIFCAASIAARFGAVVASATLRMRNMTSMRKHVRRWLARLAARHR